MHDAKRDRWAVKHGPLDESDFAATPPRDWTLLVQDVDKWDTDVATLLDHFRFLPSWRIDDVMVSYAEDGGGVGAHVDQYDVFLLQGLGQRRWAINARPSLPQEFRGDVELKQLKRFTPTHKWTLDRGDMLYLPPGVPHDGVAVGNCMTFSIGMRAPSAAELLLDFSEHVAERLPESLRYLDSDLAPARTDGEIDVAALARVAAALGPIAAMADKSDLAGWFGRFITRYRSAQLAAPPPRAISAAALDKVLAKGATLSRHPWSRFAWARRGQGATLFAAGQSWPCSRTLAQRLCSAHMQRFDDGIETADREVLRSLINEGHLALHRR
jgi:50S ribosomal protein L16 3-hydroxylase